MTTSHFKVWTVLLVAVLAASLLAVLAFTPGASAQAEARGQDQERKDGPPDPPAELEPPSLTQAAEDAPEERREDVDPEGQPYTAGELIVTFNSGVSRQTADAVTRGVGAITFQIFPDINARHLSFPGTKDERTRADRQQELKQTKQKLESDPNVKAVDYNHIYELAAVPNDERFEEQWGLTKINAPEAWDTTQGAGAKIAVLDTGIDSSHPDLADQVVDEYDYYNDDYVAQDDNGHGTHVAGTVAAITDNRTGVAGACPDCQLYISKVFGADGNWEYGTTARVISALQAARAADVDVVNMSFGIYSLDSALEDEINLTWEAGIVMVASAGNDRQNPAFFGQPHYPSTFEHVIAVSATNKQNTPEKDSNWGDWVDVAAPGEGILSTSPQTLPEGSTRNTEYYSDSGTSMAAPHVSGLAGLLASQGLTASEIRDTIETTAVDIDDNGKDPDFGFGLINAEAAVLKNSPAIVDNGTIKLGINREGHLNVPSDTVSPDGTSGVGLRYLPTGAEATAPGCECEGWGVADAILRTTGYANKSTDGGANNMSLVDFTSTASSVVSVVDIDSPSGGSTFRVTHDYHPSTATPNLYEVDVTIQNTSPVTVDARYRRVMDWDIEPTAFSEYVTVNGGSSSALLFSSEDGFASANPLAGPSGARTGNFVDAGPDDIGALFDFGFGFLGPGESKEFNIFYGAAGTEEAAEAALGAAEAEVFSLAQPSTADGPTVGTPNTFVFGFSGVGGQVVDIVAPNAPVITAPANNSYDKDGTVVISGTAEANSTVEVFDGSSSKETVTANSSGAWTKTLSDVSNGSHTYTAKARDAAGNISGASNAVTVIVDTVAPTAPRITSPANSSYNKTGTIAISGAAEADSTIEIFDSVTSKGTATTNASGAWTKTLTGVSNGPHVYTVKARDGAGNVSTASVAVRVTVDKTKPTGRIKINNGAATTRSRTVTLALSATDPAPASGVAQMCVANTTTCTAWQTYGASKRWTLKSGTAGTRTVWVRYKDRAGNVSAAYRDTIRYAPSRKKQPRRAGK